MKGYVSGNSKVYMDQRNKIVFEQGVPDAVEIFHNAQLLSWLWWKHRVTSPINVFEAADERWSCLE